MHDLAPGRSVGLRVLATVLHAGGLIAALYALPVASWPVVVVLIGFAFWLALRPKPGDVIRAQGHLDGEWTLTRSDGAREQGWQVDTERSFCQPWLVILALRRGRRRRYLPLAADAVNADALRRLRVSLRAAG